MSPAQHPERVLIVDDDPDVLDLLSRQVLEPMGYKAATAPDAMKCSTTTSTSQSEATGRAVAGANQPTRGD